MEVPVSGQLETRNPFMFSKPRFDSVSSHINQTDGKIRTETLSWPMRNAPSVKTCYYVVDCCQSLLVP